jgi:diguanylate cyclase (GGDEF)-like protein
VTEQHLTTIRRHEKIPVLLYADLDGLKEINDSLGHHEGDRALTTAAGLFKETFRSSDIVARLGGDEFVVLAAIDPEEEAESLRLRLQEKFSASNKRRNRLYDLSISVGLAHIGDEESCSIEELMAHADQAMYEDKRRKRSRQIIAPTFIRPRIEAVA